MAKNDPTQPHAAIFQTIGGPESYYSRQHDRTLVRATAPLRHREDLRRLFAAAARRLRHTLPHQTLYANGSTAAVAHLSDHGVITTAHAGDSRITLFVRHPDTGQVRAFRLTQDHSPAHAAERRRIESSGGKIEDGYVMTAKGGLAVTRAFGDRAFHPFVTDGPTIRQYALNDPRFGIGARDQAFLCVDSDGAHTENAAGRALALSGFLSRPAARNESAASFLARRAMERGSADNISVIFMDVTVPPANPMLLGVFDGHGHQGYKVSAALARIVGRLAAAPACDAPEPNTPA